jgi:hypothetical protein
VVRVCAAAPYALIISAAKAVIVKDKILRIAVPLN